MSAGIAGRAPGAQGDVDGWIHLQPQHVSRPGWRALLACPQITRSTTHLHYADLLRHQETAGSLGARVPLSGFRIVREVPLAARRVHWPGMTIDL